MFVKILKYFFLTIVGLIILTALVATPLIIKARKEGDRMYAKYDSYTRKTLAENFQLKPYPTQSNRNIKKFTPGKLSNFSKS